MNPHAPRIVEIRADVPSQWAGWSFSACGRFLIGPNRQRITRERMEGILWRDEQELRRAGLKSRRKAEKAGHRGMVTVIRLPNADWHRERFGCIAG